MTIKIAYKFRTFFFCLFAYRGSSVESSSNEDETIEDISTDDENNTPQLVSYLNKEYYLISV